MSFPFYDVATGEMIWDVGMRTGAELFKAMNAFAESLGVTSPAVDFEKYGEGYLDPELMDVFVEALVVAARSDAIFWEICQYQLPHILVLAERLGSNYEPKDEDERLLIDREYMKDLRGHMRWRP